MIVEKRSDWHKLHVYPFVEVNSSPMEIAMSKRIVLMEDDIILFEGNQFSLTGFEDYVRRLVSSVEVLKREVAKSV